MGLVDARNSREAECRNGVNKGRGAGRGSQRGDGGAPPTGHYRHVVMTLSPMEAPGGFWAGQWGDLTSTSRLTQAPLSLDWKGEQGGSRETNQEAVTIIQARSEAGLGRWWWLTWARFWVGLEGRANRICWKLQVGSEKKRRVRDDTSNSGLTAIEWGYP